MMSPRNIASSVSLLVLLSGACHGSVTTCSQLKAAFDLTKTQDVVIQMHPLQTIDCGSFTTMSMSSHKLTVESSQDMSKYPGTSELRQIRFVVKNGGKMSWETNVRFRGTTNRNVNGGGVFVGEGSDVRFLNNLEMEDVTISSATDASYRRSGGCVYADGDFRVDGSATFTSCDVIGGGKSASGNGGALFVGLEGDVLFDGTLDISDVSIADDEGSNGGGIYNKGSVTIKGDATFENLRAESGGAIYNTEDGRVKFKSKATALFKSCRAYDGVGSAVYDEGSVKFSGPATFVNTDAPSIYISPDGKTELSKDSEFSDINTKSSPAIYVATGGEVSLPSSVSFAHKSGSKCSTVYYQEDKSCL